MYGEIEFWPEMENGGRITSGAAPVTPPGKGGAHTEMKGARPGMGGARPGTGGARTGSLYLGRVT